MRTLVISFCIILGLIAPCMDTTTTRDAMGPVPIYPIIGELSDGNTIEIGVGVAIDPSCMISVMKQNKAYAGDKSSEVKNLYVLQGNELILATRTCSRDIYTDTNMVLNVLYFLELLFKVTIKLADRSQPDSKLRVCRLARSELGFCNPKQLINAPLGTRSDILPTSCTAYDNMSKPDISEHDSGSPVLNEHDELVGLVVQGKSGTQFGVDFREWQTLYCIKTCVDQIKNHVQMEFQRKIVHLKCLGEKQIGVVVGARYVLTVFPNKLINRAKNVLQKISIEYALHKYRPTKMVHYGEFGDQGAAIVLLYFQELNFNFVFDIYKQSHIGWLYLYMSLEKDKLSLLDFKNTKACDNDIVNFRDIEKLKSKARIDGAPVLKGEFLFGLILNQKRQKNKELNVINFHFPSVKQAVEHTIAQMDLQIYTETYRDMILPVVDGNQIIRVATVVSTNCALAVPVITESEIRIAILYQTKTIWSNDSTAILLKGLTLGVFYFRDVTFNVHFELPKANALYSLERVYLLTLSKPLNFQMRNVSPGEFQGLFKLKPETNENGTLSKIHAPENLEIRDVDMGAPIFERFELFGLIHDQEGADVRIIDLSLVDTLESINRFVAQKYTVLKKESTIEFKDSAVVHKSKTK